MVLNESLKKDFLSFLLLTLAILFIAGILSYSTGFFLKGFDTRLILDQFSLYSSILLFGWAIVLSGFLYELIETKGDAKYGNSLFFNSKGRKPSLPFFEKFNNFSLFLGSSVVFAILGLVTIFRTQTALTGVPSIAVEQAFSAVGSIIYSSLLIPASENMFSMAIIVMIVVFLRIIARRMDWSSATFGSFVYILVPIIIGLFGVANHNLRYSGVDLSLVIVFFFWAIGGLLTIITGSFIPFWVLHIMNNLFIDLGRFFSQEVVLPVAIISIIVLALIFFVYTAQRKKRGII